MSHFGDLMKKLRKERGLTLETVAKKIGSHKGYVSGIENGKVNPPSVKIIRKFSRLFAQDERTLVRIAWVDKAPSIVREDAQRFATMTQTEGPSSANLSAIPLLNTVTSGYSAELGADGRPKALVQDRLVLPRFRTPLEFAVTLCDDSMEQQTGISFNRGDVALLTKEEKIRNGMIAYVIFTARQKRQALVRQIMLEQNDHIVLQPLNKEFPLEFLTHDDVDVLYRVVGKLGLFEPVSIDMGT